MEGIELLFIATFYGFPLDLALIAYLFLVCMLVALLAAVLKSKKLLQFVYYPLLLFVAFASFILAFSDAEMYRVWGSRFNSQALQYMQHPQEAAASSSEAKWVTALVISILLAIVFFYILRRILRRHSGVFNYRWQPSIAALVLLCASVPALRGGFQTIPINQSSVYYSESVFENTSAVNGLWNMMYYLVNPTPTVRTEDYRFGLAETNTTAYFGLQGERKFTLCNEGSRPNVILFILESYSSYASDFFGKKYSSTPFLDSLAATGLAFTNAYAQGDRTDKGLAAVLGGWPGQPWQSILTQPDKAAKLPSIAMEALLNKYNTCFFYGGDAAFGNMSAYLRSAGFRKIVDEEAFSDVQKGSKWGAHDEFLMDMVLKEMATQRMPVFNTILTLSSHEPYEIPGKQNQGKDELSRFLESVAYTDRCLRRFMSEAQKQPWFGNSIFVFVADHGRNLGLQDMDFFQPRHFQVPIVFWGPALQPSCKGKIDASICSQTDIAATITEEVFGSPRGRFPWSRNLAKTHAETSFYSFADGFGYLSKEGHVVWGNHPARVMEKSGASDSMLLVGKSLQFEIIKMYNNF